MSTYGKFEVIRYPSFYVVTDMQTHNHVTRGTSDRAQAHRWAKLLMDGKPLPASALPKPSEASAPPKGEDSEPLLEETPSPDAPDDSALRDIDAGFERARAESEADIDPVM